MIRNHLKNPYSDCPERSEGGGSYLRRASGSASPFARMRVNYARSFPDRDETPFRGLGSRSDESGLPARYMCAPAHFGKAGRPTIAFVHKAGLLLKIALYAPACLNPGRYANNVYMLV